jgi:hypothetical protein
VHHPSGAGVPRDVLTWQEHQPFRVWVHARQGEQGFKTVGVDFQWIGNQDGFLKVSPEEISLRLKLASLIAVDSSSDILQASSFRGIPLGQVLDIHSSILVESKLGQDSKNSQRVNLVKDYAEKVFDSVWLESRLSRRAKQRPDTGELRAKTKDSLIVAFVYAKQSEGGTKRAAKRTGELLGISNEMVYMALRVARKHGWLTSQGSGNSGGSLTELGLQQFAAIKGEAILKDILK